MRNFNFFLFNVSLPKPTVDTLGIIRIIIRYY